MPESDEFLPPSPWAVQAALEALRELAEKQEPMGAEFDKVWSENVEKLYEN